MAESPVIVVGGGIVGLSTAYFLARRGTPVLLIEREKIGIGASSGNAGILALGHPPLPSPGLLGQMLRLFVRRTNPVHVAPRADPSLLRWMLQFRRACREEPFDRSMDLLARLGWDAGRCFRTIVEREQIDCEYSPSGWLEVMRDPATLEHARRTSEILRRHGYVVDEWNGGELHDREPAFRTKLAGALHYTDSAFANPAKFIRGLAQAAEGLGVELRPQTDVRRLLVESGRIRGVELDSGERVPTNRLVLAAGCWSTELARTIGVEIPMQAGKGYHTHLTGLASRPSTTCVLAETFVAVTPIDGGLQLAGTVELSGLNLKMVERRLAMLRLGARDYLHGIDEARVESDWCGLRPMTADGLPVVGWAPGVEGVFVATGHAMMGFLLGPLTGRLVSEALVDGHPSLEIGALAADRF